MVKRGLRVARALPVGSRIFTTPSPIAERSQVVQAAKGAMAGSAAMAARAVPVALAAMGAGEEMG